MLANNVTINGKVYVQVETTLQIDQVVEVDQLNGRQGDNWRDVNIQLLKSGLPRDLGSYSVDLVGKDSAGKIKYTNKATVNNAKNGLVTMRVAKQFYQATGRYQEAFLRVVDTDGTVISSVAIDMEVIKNSLILTSGESTNFLQTIDDLNKDLNTRMDVLETTLKSNMQTVQAMNQLVAQYNDMISKNMVVTAGKENHFTKPQHIDAGINISTSKTGHADIDEANIGKMTGGAMNSIMNLIKAVPTVEVEPWSRNWTGIHCKKDDLGDAMVVQRIKLPGGSSLIGCVGNVHYDVDGDWGNAYIDLPYSMGRGSICVGATYNTSTSYVEMAYPQNNRVHITFEKPVHGNVWTSLFIMTIKW